MSNDNPIDANGIAIKRGDHVAFNREPYNTAGVVTYARQGRTGTWKISVNMGNGTREFNADVLRVV